MDELRGSLIVVLAAWAFLGPMLAYARGKEAGRAEALNERQGR